MPSLRLLTAAICLLTACSNDCEEARDKIDSCRDEIVRAAARRGGYGWPLAIDDECSPRSQCLAECVNDSDCRAIASVATTEPDANSPPGAQEFYVCALSCYRE